MAKKNTVPKKEFESWFNNKEKMSLEYKVTLGILAEGNTNYFYFESRIKKELQDSIKNKIQLELELPNLTIIAPSPFFANNDKRNNDEYDKIAIGILYSGVIKMEIFTLINDLVVKLENSVPEFFCIENFGARQSKGFGSFTIDGITEKFFKESLEKNFPFSKRLAINSRNLHDVFQNIDNVYKKLKNDAANDVSQIRDHYLDKGIEWEKRFITKVLVKNNTYSSDKEIMYVRALLGLAELHDYQQDKVKVKIQHIQNGAKIINRFQSPIKFKVFSNRLFVVAEPDHIDELIGERFNFYVGEDLKHASIKEELQVPESFSIVEFLNNNLH